MHHRQALESIIRNLEMAIELTKGGAWDDREHGVYQGMREALDLVRTELERADSLVTATLPTDDPLARAQRILAELKAVLDRKN